MNRTKSTLVIYIFANHTPSKSFSSLKAHPRHLAASPPLSMTALLPHPHHLHTRQSTPTLRHRMKTKSLCALHIAPRTSLQSKSSHRRARTLLLSGSQPQPTLFGWNAFLLGEKISHHTAVPHFLVCKYSENLPLSPRSIFSSQNLLYRH